MDQKTKAVIDMYASLSIQKSAIERNLRKLRDAIEALGEGRHEGELHAVNVHNVVSSSLSIPIAKSMLTPQQIADAMVTTESVRITVDH